MSCIIFVHRCGSRTDGPSGGRWRTPARGRADPLTMHTHSPAGKHNKKTLHSQLHIHFKNAFLQFLQKNISLVSSAELSQIEKDIEFENLSGSQQGVIPCAGGGVYDFSR